MIEASDFQGQPQRSWPFLFIGSRENANVEAAMRWPDVTVKGLFVALELAFSSDGLQSGVLVPSVLNANAPIV